MNEAGFHLAPSLARALSGEPVRVGTENRAKLAAVRQALEIFAEDGRLGSVGRNDDAPTVGVSLEIVPVGVESGVPEQPIGWEQIIAGARTRARAAQASGGCALGVGIEDGLVRLADGPADPATDDVRDYFNVGCAFITDGQREGFGFSSGFAYPTAPLSRAIREQEPIGDLFDDHWSANRPAARSAAADPRESATDEPSGRGGGNIGRLTGGRLQRAAYGGQAVVCGLVRFLHTDLYD